MKALRRLVASLALVLLAMGLPDAAGAQPGLPSIEVTRLGPVDVEDERRIDLDEATVDLAGRAWGFGSGDRVAVLARPLGRDPWSEMASDEAPAGGLFQISGLRFPEAGSYELVACLLSSAARPGGGGASSEMCGDMALAASRKLLVRVTARPAGLEAEHPSDLAVLSVGGVSIDPQGVTPVPARGEVVLRARGIAAGTRVYLVLLAPYSDRAYLQGPARPGPQPDLFTVQGVPLEVPGDPRGAHLELVAVATPELLAAGPMSFASLRRREARTSPAVEVVVDHKSEAGNSVRVPMIAVTQIGHQTVAAEAAADPLEVEPGDAVEVGQYERVPEGARVYILVRPRGSGFWLVQGPAVLRGGRSPEDPRQGPPRVTWLWPSARFELADGGKAKRRRRAREEFEVLAVLSASTLPEGWIDSAALSGSFIQTVSQLVRVSVPPGEPLPDFRPSLSRIGRRDADPEDETPVGAAERIELATGEELPPSMRLYLARHKVGSSLWTLVEAIPQGKSHVVPALSFVNPHPQEGARYQLIAVVTRGVLPAEQLEYDDLVHAAVASSEVVTVRYEAGEAPSFTSRLAKGTQTMTEIPWARIFWTLLLLAVALLAVLSLLEWGLGVVSKLARSAANRIAGTRKVFQDWLGASPKINPAHFLLGIIIAVFVFYGLLRYIPLYGKAVAAVTGFTAQESSRMAYWVVLLTALAGTFRELASERSSEAEKKRGNGLAIGLGFILVALVLFQGFLYGAFLGKLPIGLVAILLGIAFVLFASIEAMAFFFITRLTVIPAGHMVVRLAYLPLATSELFLRFIEHFSDSIPKRKLQEKPRREADDEKEEPS